MTYSYAMLLPISLGLVGYNALLTGLMTFIRRHDRVGLHYFLWSFFVFLWGMGLTFMLNNNLPEHVAMEWGIFSQRAALFIPPTWFHFVKIYVQDKNIHKKIVWSFYLVAFAIFPFTFTPHFVAGYKSVVGIKFYPIPGAAYTAFTFFFTAVIFYSFFVFYKAIDIISIDKKRDYQIVFWASVYGFSMGSLSLLPVYGILFPQYNLIFMPIWQFLLAYAMVKYKIFDLQELAHAAHRDKLAAIGTLATSINHEIRNPLYVIQGLAESHLVNMEEKIYPDDKEAIRKSNEIHKKTSQQASRAMDIMKRFAIFAKQQISEKDFWEKLNLAEIVNNILPLVNHEFELKEIELSVLVPQAICLKGDRRQLEQILFNLLINAAQAVQSGRNGQDYRSEKAKIKIDVSQTKQDVYIKIEDNGPGIGINQVERVFEPFYTTKTEGTGLGLYITKKLVERNGGKISVKSHPGRTVFSLKFNR